MRKYLSTLLVASFMLAITITPAFATSVNVGLNYGTLSGLGTKDLREGIMGIINVLLGFIGIIALVVILWGGFRWMTSAGNDEKIVEAKKIISSGIVGLILIFISYALVSFVIINLLAATGAAQ